ncbi:MAG: hypothetical protein FRX49_08827 [Trebouxia sp. A1-2]|nr:MAG: hypothetical protein FRX49_08827 [Trebouxia sp. A1-2]
MQLHLPSCFDNPVPLYNGMKLQRGAMDMAERGGDCHSEQLPPSSDAEIDRCQPSHSLGTLNVESWLAADSIDMDQGSRVKKEDSVGFGPQKKFVKVFLMAQYAGQSNTK